MEVLEVRGVAIPRVGFGTWQLGGRTCYEAVRHALELGYRHFDTAQMYGNESEVGRAVAESGVDRSDIWVTTKIAQDQARAARVRSSHEASLRRLGTDHVDLLLLHWPNHEVPLGETLGAMDELREEGKTRTIGVSNFTPSLLQEAVSLAPIVTDQVEYHPYLAQDRLRELAAEHDLALTAYSPSAKGKAVGDPVLTEIGDAHGKTAVQVALRWLLQQPNVVIIPRSSSAEHRAENLDVFDFELSDDEMERIFELARSREQRLIDPGFAPDWER